MKKTMIKAVAIVLVLGAGSILPAAGPNRARDEMIPPAPSQLPAAFKGPFDFGSPRVPEIRYYRMVTEVVHIGFDGKRTGTETYILKLKCVPGALSSPASPSDEYTCGEFRLRQGDGPEATIPELHGWTYSFNPEIQSGIDDKGQVFGVPHAKFDDIVDSRGAKIPPVIRYAVYNNFIDFHAFNDVLPRPIPGGRGIQDLTAIGQKIVHAAAFTAPPVNLGSAIKEGSFFRNGEMTLEFKGLTVVDGAACAIIGYDSGESTLKMIMPMVADKDIVTTGGSIYRGDIYLDLTTRAVRKVTLDESVITETTVPGPVPKMDAYTVRHLLLRLVSEEEYGR